ncbi:MAG: hypothetical protein MJE77_26625 [Proteobacteria bacterium]|nr:hypothetical protein [Pseudomonadota bacterium]
MSKLGIIFAIVALAACGGSDADDLAGIYQVTSHTLNQDSCDREGAAADGGSHLRIRPDSFFTEEFLAVDECESADTSTCNDDGLLGGFFDVNGWTLEVSTASGGGSLTCYLGYTLETLEETESGVIRIEKRRYGDTDDNLSAAQCSTDEAGSRGTDMMCEQFEVIVAMLIE